MAVQLKLTLAALVLSITSAALYSVKGAGYCTKGTDAINYAGRSRISRNLDCRRLCDNNNLCRGYSLNRGAGTCYTYTSRMLEPTYRGTAEECFVKDTGFIVSKGACSGGQQGTSATQVEHVQGCLEICQADPLCMGFTFDVTWNIRRCTTTTSQGVVGDNTNMVKRCASRSNIKYTLYVRTLEIQWAETDDVDDMKWKISGSKGVVHTPPGEIDDPDRDDLEKGNVDKYEFMMPDVGDVQSFTIIGRSGSKDRWCPDYIHLTTELDPIPRVFKNHQQACTWGSYISETLQREISLDAES